MDLTDTFELNTYGHEECRPGKSFGPAVRDHYLIHFIYSGKGIFRSDRTESAVFAGQMFVIRPGEITYYEADRQDPWIYAWIGFSGRSAHKFACATGLDSAIILQPDSKHRLGSILAELSSVKQLNTSSGLLAKSLLYAFLSEFSRLFETTLPGTGPSRSNVYVEAVETYIKDNYQNELRVARIAAMAGLDRCYLSTLFKKSTGKSIQEYLIDYRLMRAMRLLRENDLTVLETARSVGYTDQFAFSKAFSKKYGIPPGKAKEVSNRGRC